MTITSAEILGMRDALRASDPSLTPAQVVQGVRTLVHERLQAENPAPYQLPAPAPGKSRADFLAKLAEAKTDAEKKALHVWEMNSLAERKAEMHAAVDKFTQVAFQRERPPGIRDAHHYAQMVHGRGLWEQTDQLVASALAETGVK